MVTGEPVSWRKVSAYLKWLFDGRVVARTAGECEARWSEIADVQQCTWHSAAQGARARAGSRAELRRPSARVSVVNPRTGRSVGGKAAPTKRGLEKWLAENPGGRPTDAWIAANFEYVECEARRGAAWALRAVGAGDSRMPSDAGEEAPSRGGDGAASSGDVREAGGSLPDEVSPEVGEQTDVLRGA